MKVSLPSRALVPNRSFWRCAHARVCVRLRDSFEVLGVQTLSLQSYPPPPTSAFHGYTFLLGASAPAWCDMYSWFPSLVIMKKVPSYFFSVRFAVHQAAAFDLTSPNSALIPPLPSTNSFSDFPLCSGQDLPQT